MIEHLVEPAPDAVPIRPLSTERLKEWLARQEKRIAAWVAANGFTAAGGKICILPDVEGGIGEVLLGVAEEDDLWAYGGLPASLPEGTYRLVEDGLGEAAQGRAALGKVLPRLEAQSDWTKDRIEAIARSLAEAEGLKLGEVAQPLRAAVTVAPKYSRTWRSASRLSS